MNIASILMALSAHCMNSLDQTYQHSYEYWLQDCWSLLQWQKLLCWVEYSTLNVEWAWSGCSKGEVALSGSIRRWASICWLCSQPKYLASSPGNWFRYGWMHGALNEWPSSPDLNMHTKLNPDLYDRTCLAGWKPFCTNSVTVPSYVLDHGVYYAVKECHVLCTAWLQNKVMDRHWNKFP